MEARLDQEVKRVGATNIEDLRKDLFDDFTKLSRDSVLLEKEHLQVYLRVRPLTSAEQAGEAQECVAIEGSDSVLLKAPRASLNARHSERLGPQLAQRFQFSQVYGARTTQRQIFDGTTKALVKGVLQGGNSLIFTYGVTNAGKTFTFLGPESDGGILPRSLNVIFNSVEGKIYSQNNIKPHRCVDFTRLTKEQQDEDATNKKNLLRRFKENYSQKSLSSTSSSSCSSFDSSTSNDVNGDIICLDETTNVKYSIWVSFCEIYNENIHDLLDLVPNGSLRRTVLRLAQDIKGNAFVKDLMWVQTTSADEALKIVKIGRKNQSFSSTKLNSISSRSHSIFSIRVLRIEDVGVPRVQTISELSLCDLAGSERCAKTQNHGERLKEAGNINTSLLTLGKCINALRANQLQPKFHQHVPFRESKLTHYLQGFFCGRGKACMIININPCTSMLDETLNVLKFSAVAQKVVVLNSKPAPSIALKRSARDVSMRINNADRKDLSRRSSLMAWEMSLEDVQEDEDGEEVDESLDTDDESMGDNTVLEAEEVQELSKLQKEIEELREKLSKEESEKVTMEACIREEVTAEFMELFSNMEKDYSERLLREKEIFEERAERRLEILKNLFNRTVGEKASSDETSDESSAKEMNAELLENMMEAMRTDLSRIKGHAEAVQLCLTNVPESPLPDNHLKTEMEELRDELLTSKQQLCQKTKELDEMSVQTHGLNDQLLQANRDYEHQKSRYQELMSICQEKDAMVSTLQSALEQNVEAATKDRVLIDSIKEEMLHLRNSCKCKLNEERKEQVDDTLKAMAKLKAAHDATLSLERAEVRRVTNENESLNNKLLAFQKAANEQSLKSEMLQIELNTEIQKVKELSEKLNAARHLVKTFQEESAKIQSLTIEVEKLQQELSDSQLSFERKQAECERTIELFQESKHQISNLEQEISQTRANKSRLETFCNQLKSEHDAQAQEYQLLLKSSGERTCGVTQIRSSPEVLKELAALNIQQGEMEERDSEDDCWTILQIKLMQMLNKLSQDEKVRSMVHTIVESGILKTREEEERRVTTIKKDLALKNFELEANAQELLNLRRLVNDGHNMLESVRCDLQQKEREQSDVRDQLCEANLQKERLEKQVLILIEDKKKLQQRLCKAKEKIRQPVDITEQTVDPMRSMQSNHLIYRENIQPFRTSSQGNTTGEGLVEQEIFQTTRSGLFADAKYGAKRVSESQEVIPKKQLGENQEINKKLGSKKEDRLRKPSNMKTEMNGEYSFTVMQEMAVLESSVVRTNSFNEERFPKPELEISFTPLKPDRLNVRKPGEEESVTIKLRRTARKRKSPVIQDSVESKNRKNRKVTEQLSTAEGKKETGFREINSPENLKKKKGRALQKIEEFIQGSPTLFGSKAKKIMSLVKSPDLELASENNKPKRTKRKLFKTQVSSPMDIPTHTIVGGSDDDKESDHLIIKRKLRTRTSKR